MGWLFLCFMGAALAGAQEVDPFGDNPPPLGVGLISEPGVTQGIQGKWRTIIIPSIEFHETPVEDAIEFLRIRSAELDTAEVDPERKGVNIVLKSSPGWGAGVVSLSDPAAFSFGATPRISLKMKAVSIGDALQLVAGLSGLEVKFEDYAAVLSPPEEDVAGLLKAIEEARKAIGAKEVPSIHPRTSLLEALESEYRKLVLRGKADDADNAERKAIYRRISQTRIAIGKARRALLEYWDAEREIGEAWQAEVSP